MSFSLKELRPPLGPGAAVSDRVRPSPSGCGLLRAQGASWEWVRLSLDQGGFLNESFLAPPGPPRAGAGGQGSHVIGRVLSVRERSLPDRDGYPCRRRVGLWTWRSRKNAYFTRCRVWVRFPTCPASQDSIGCVTAMDDRWWEPLADAGWGAG